MSHHTRRRDYPADAVEITVTVVPLHAAPAVELGRFDSEVAARRALGLAATGRGSYRLGRGTYRVRFRTWPLAPGAHATYRTERVTVQ